MIWRSRVELGGARLANRGRKLLGKKTSTSSMSDAVIRCSVMIAAMPSIAEWFAAPLGRVCRMSCRVTAVDYEAVGDATELDRLLIVVEHCIEQAELAFKNFSGAGEAFACHERYCQARLTSPTGL